MQTPKVIFFDLDDTLVGSTRLYDIALDKAGIDPHGALYKECRKEVKELLGPAHVSSHHRLLYFKRYLEKKGQFSAETLVSLMENYEKILVGEIGKNWLQLHRDEFFQNLASRFVLGLITNETTRTQMLKLREIDPRGAYFKDVVTSEEVGVQKPDLRIFHVAQERSGKLPTEILFVGDSVKNDLEPGTEMKFQVLGTREFLNESSPGSPFKWIDRLSDLQLLIS